MYAKVYPKENGFQVHSRFNQKDDWYFFLNKKEAENKANELNVEYYSNNKNQLPKGITLDKNNKRFRFHVRLNHKEIKHIKSSKKLCELVEIRNHLIKNILSLF